MRTLLLAGALACFSLGAAMADPAEDALKAKAIACIRSAAPEVTAKAESLSDAVNVLVDALCAVQVGRLAAYDANARTLADWQGRSSPAQLAGVALDPLTGELATPPGFKMEWDSSSAELGELKRVTPREELNVVAAQAVIAARKPAGGQ